MELNLEKLKSLWGNKNNIFRQSGENSNRYDDLTVIVNEFLDTTIDSKYLRDFAPLSDDLLGNNGSGNRETMKDKIGEHTTNNMWKLIGGFDGKTIKAKWRIISASLGKKENFYENTTYSTYHRKLWANSNFVTNNYPDQIAKFIQCSKEDSVNFEKCIDESRIVLTWKSNNYLGQGDDNYFSASKQRLETRFPPKFLWMWANKDTVLHPYSLMAFRNFLDTEFGKEIIKDYTPENITNMNFDNFITKWKDISNKIFENLDIEKNEENISELSKLISIIMTQETDIKNISDLLTTGNRAVILWGPPGTGKTYESEQVVKELLEVGEDENFEEYLFSNKEKNEDKKGYYEIVQFHPNYTYQDFIGGIAPKLDDDSNNISYELKKGIFKRFCDEANKEKNKNKKYIFIIDEINRAELSAVFGELLYALEYRGKAINLPNFKKPFTIPTNVYIIGTMNNVDKSLVTFDLALRRRFGFFKLMPKLDVLEDVLCETIEEISLSKYVDKCKKLNEDIKNNSDLGENYQIGQAYFLKIKDFLPQKGNNEELQIITSFELEKLWIYNIEPLLEEYFGMSIEDDSMLSKLKELKKEFEVI